LHFPDPSRVVLSISSFRLFSYVPVVKETFFGLVSIIPTFLNMMSLLGCIMYMYAVVGTRLLSGINRL
jgi:hypothetical protein